MRDHEIPLEKNHSEIIEEHTAAANYPVMMTFPLDM
jgi:hypothetical protein